MSDEHALETALGGVLSRYQITRGIAGGIGPWDAGDLASDLADAMRDLLGRDHVVVVGQDRHWVLEHSLNCRMSGEMAACHITYDIDAYGAPKQPGRYRCQWDPDGIIDFEPVG